MAYFDGLADTILNVAMVTPKPGLLQPHIVHLLALSTPVEVVLLGASFVGEEMQLVPETLFSLPCDQLHTSCLVGGVGGRIFMGGRDGHLYEFYYQHQERWWGKKTTKVCHTSSNLSWILPGFLGSFTEENPLVQIVIDNTMDGQGLERVITITTQKLVLEVGHDSGDRKYYIYCSSCCCSKC